MSPGAANLARARRVDAAASALPIATVWQAVDAALAAELVALWTKTGVVADPAAAAARATEAVCIARDDDGAIGAVATAVLQVVPRLRLPMYYYRQFFAAPLRGLGQAMPFLDHARRVLAAHNASLPEAESCGLLLELENPMLASRYDRTVVDEAGATFIGWSPRGLPLYAAYFPGARIGRGKNAF